MIDNFENFPFKGKLSFHPLIKHFRNLKDVSGRLTPAVQKDLHDIFEQNPELNQPMENMDFFQSRPQLLNQLINLILPPLYWENEMISVVAPFSTIQVFTSPRFNRLCTGNDCSMDDCTFMGRLNLDVENFSKGRLIKAYLFILQKVYGIHQRFDFPLITTVKDPDTGLNRHYSLRFDTRFVDVVPLKQPPPLADDEKQFLLAHLTEPEELGRLIPPENFELHGLTLIHASDVTETEILSTLERDLIDQKAIISSDGFARIQDQLRSYFRRPDLLAGLAVRQDDQVLLLNSGSAMTHNCIFASSSHAPISLFAGSPFEKANQEQTMVRIHDIQEDPWCRKNDTGLSDTGIRSLLIVPLSFNDEPIGSMNIGTTQPGDLGPIDEMLMSQIQPLFAMAVKKAVDDLENQIQRIIKEKCTAIHPAVEWKFRHAAIHLLEDLRRNETTQIEPIVFKDVYPLYGISDIRGSTHERNKAIQKDLTEHLVLALEVVKLAVEARPILILKELTGRIEKHLNRINSGLGSGDEVLIARFITDEVESIFAHVEGFDPKIQRAVNRYRSTMDPNMGSVYRLRQDFERSVRQLNKTLTNYLDQEEAEAQEIFPHYFERHQTDGVDYLIYLGQSLLENETFNPLYLKNLRLWQLKVAAGMALQAEIIKPSLKIPMDIAQLILVQNSPLSIRFRFDEKRFDVDGAYDIRSEIIKSRIDKAMVKGGKERLTQPGKIAIVYSHPAEAREMRQHIEFLQAEGYLTDELESLDLEDLPDVQGLKSLRVGINLESRAAARKIERLAG
jgi:hypothetical protein